MPRTPHSAAFIAVRDALLETTDADRLPMARLLGTMTSSQLTLTPGAIALLRALAELDDANVRRFQRWCRRYLTQFGGVPSAAGRMVDSGAYRRRP